MTNLIKKEITVIGLFILILIFWMHIPLLQFQGEGYYYFAKEVAQITIDYPPHYDNFARIFFLFSSDLFKENTYLYMTFMLIYMLLIDLTLYLVVRKIVDKNAAFFTTAFFSLSMIANYDMFSNGGYQYFAQRASPLPFLLISFALLVYFLNNFSVKYYLLSLGLYLFGIWLGFFGTWFLPAIIFYPIFKIFFFNNFKQQLLKLFWVPMPFILGNYLIIKNSVYANSEDSLLYLFVNKLDFLFLGVLEQLSIITLPLGLYKEAVFLLQKHIFFDFSENIAILINGSITLLMYLLAAIVIVKLKPRLKILVFSVFFTIIFMLVLNLYLNYAAVLNTVGSSRYFYYSYVFVAIFWGLFLTATLVLRNSILKRLILSIFLLLMGYNYYLIDQALEVDKWRHDANRKTINFLKSKADLFRSKPSYVYLPSSLGAYGNSYAQRYFSHPDGYFIIESLESIDHDKLITKKVKVEDLYFLHFDSKQEKVIDFTEQARLDFAKALNQAD